MNKLFLIFLLFSSLYAYSLHNILLNQFHYFNEGSNFNFILDYSCINQTLLIKILNNSSSQPVSSVDSYLIYTDYSYQLLDSSTSNNNGFILIDLSRFKHKDKMFVLHLEKQGYSTLEIEFFLRCGAIYNWPRITETPNNEPTTNETIIQNTTTNNSTNNLINNSTNISLNNSKDMNTTVSSNNSVSTTSNNNSICSSIYILIMLLFLHIHLRIEPLHQYQ